MRFLAMLAVLAPGLALASTPQTTTFPCRNPASLTFQSSGIVDSCSLQMPWLNGYRFHIMTVDNGSIRQPDGDLPQFYVFKPDLPPAEPRPLLVMLHGGGIDRETPEHPGGGFSMLGPVGPCMYENANGSFLQIASRLGYYVVMPVNAWGSLWAGCGEVQPDHGPRHYASWIIEAAMHYMLNGPSGLAIDDTRVYMGGVCGGSIGAAPNGLRDSRVSKLLLDAHTDDLHHYALIHPWLNPPLRHNGLGVNWQDRSGALSWSYGALLDQGVAPKPTFLLSNARDASSFRPASRKLIGYMENPAYFDQNLHAGLALEFDRDAPTVLYGHGNTLIQPTGLLMYLWLEDRRFWIRDPHGPGNNATLGREVSNDNGTSPLSTDTCIGDRALMAASGDRGVLFEQDFALDRWFSSEVSVTAWYLDENPFASGGKLEVLDANGSLLAEKNLHSSQILRPRMATDVTLPKPPSGQIRVRLTVNGSGALLLDHLVVSEREPGDWTLEAINSQLLD